MARVTPESLALAQPRRDARRLARPAPGPRLRRGARRRPTSRSGRRRRRPSGSASSTTDDARDPLPADRAAPSASGTAQVPGVRAGQRYGFRVDGPWDPRRGRGSTRHKLLLDPYARAITGEPTSGPALLGPRRRDPTTRSTPTRRRTMPRSVVVHDEFDWGDDRPMRRRWRDTVIYELHVKGITQLHDRVPEELRGTYAGLGHARRRSTTSATSASPRSSCCRCTSSSPSRPSPTRGLTNYWGYNTIGFFAPHAAYSSSGDRGQQVTEFKEMVKSFHAAGHRGHPRRGLQPHRRGRGRPGRRSPSAASTTSASTSASGGTGQRLLGRHRLRQHRRRHQRRRAAADPGLAALLGHRDARRRLPLRPRSRR